VNRALKLARCLLISGYRDNLICDGVAAGVEHERMLRQLPNLKTIIDIGANRGQFALAARWGFPQARIFSFEPLAEPAERFRKVFAGNHRVRLYEVAIAPERGERTIHVSREDDSSSLLPISPLQVRLFPNTTEVRKQSVRVGPLRDFLRPEEVEPPALLKLDVQGYELEALMGCEGLLDLFAYVYAECSFVELYTGQALADEVIDWLRDRGYRLIGIYNIAYAPNGQPVQGDFLFLRTGDHT